MRDFGDILFCYITEVSMYICVHEYMEFTNHGFLVIWSSCRYFTEVNGVIHLPEGIVLLPS
jgi:hypothetical protein